MKEVVCQIYNEANGMFNTIQCMRIDHNAAAAVSNLLEFHENISNGSVQSDNIHEKKTSTSFLRLDQYLAKNKNK